MKEMKKWKFDRVLSLSILLIMSLCLFVSCDEDNEPGIVYYTAGFESYNESSTSSSFLSEMIEIESIYREEMNISGTPFQKTGTVSQCDEELIKACQRAEERIKARSWNATFVFYVYNATTGNEIYRFQYPVANFI